MKLTRRNFLKGAATAAASIALPSIVPSTVFGKNAPSNRVTIALIGAGGMGQYHLRAMNTMDECKVIGICDVNDQRREQARHLVDLPYEKTTRDFYEILAREDIDAVNIATPDHWHTPIAIAAMKAGKAVYVQKPISLCIDEGRVLSDTVKRLGAVCQCGSQQRSSRNFRYACELVRNGYLGDIKEIYVGLEEPYYPTTGVKPFEPVPDYFDYDRWLGPAPYVPYSNERVIHFRANFDYSGGYYSDWGAHHLDIVQWALGKDNSGPVKVDGKGTFQKEGIFDVPMSYEVRYEYADGTPVFASEKYKQGIKFVGTKGWLFVSRQEFYGEPRTLLTQKIGASEVHLEESPNHLQNFFQSVRENKDPIVTAEIGHRSATVCHLGNLSMRLGRPLQWDPVREEFIGDNEANRMRSYSMRAPWRLM